MYTTAGAEMWKGGDAYSVTSPRGWHYLYPPLFALLIAPLAALPSEWAAVVWFAVNIAILFATISECRKLIHAIDITAYADPRQREARHETQLTIATTLAVAFPIFNCLQRGQVGLLVTYLLLLGMRLIVSPNASLRTQALGGAIASATVVLRIPMLLPVCWMIGAGTIVATRRARPESRISFAAPGIGALVGLCTCVIVIPAVLIGPASNFRYLRNWYDWVIVNPSLHHDGNFDIHSPRNQSLDNSMHLLNTRVDHLRQETRATANANADQVPTTQHLLLKGAICAFVLLASAWVTTDDRRGYCLGLGIACALSIVLSPISWGHHFQFLLPLLLVASTWIADHQMPRTARVVLWMPAALLILHYSFVRYVAAIGLLGFGTTVWLSIICLAIFRAKVRQFQPLPARRAITT